VPIVLERGSESLYLVQRLRDEAHRFAITFHRSKRGKSMVASSLEGVEGLGPAASRTSARAVRFVERAAPGDLGRARRAGWLPGDVARRLYDHLQAPRRHGPRRGVAMSEVSWSRACRAPGARRSRRRSKTSAGSSSTTCPRTVVRVDELVDGDRTTTRAWPSSWAARAESSPTPCSTVVRRNLKARHENAKILFLDAPDEVLIHRFEGNRRRHPFPAATLAESIAGERAQLAVAS
jgi:hypothetical protein